MADDWIRRARMENQMNTFERIRKIICETEDLQPEDVTLDKRIDVDLGVDSLDKIECIMQIEDEFDIEIEDEEALKVDTVEDLVKLVDRLMAAKA